MAPIPAALRQMPSDEVRRYHTGKRSVRDLRMQRDFPLGDNYTRFELAPVLDAWATHCALGGAEDPWS